MMNLLLLKRVLGWCCVINYGLILVMTLFFLFALDPIYEIQSLFLNVPQEDYNTLWFLVIGIWKILVLVFNLIPYLALRIVGRADESAPEVLP